jgi:ankyrin repeat protein
MKHLLLTTIAAVVLVGCGPSVDIHQAAEEGNIEAVKQAIADGADVNALGGLMQQTPLDYAEGETADLLRKHGGKTGEELKAEGK